MDKKNNTGIENIRGNHPKVSLKGKTVKVELDGETYEAVIE